MWMMVVMRMRRQWMKRMVRCGPMRMLGKMMLKRMWNVEWMNRMWSVHRGGRGGRRRRGRWKKKCGRRRSRVASGGKAR